MLRYVSTIYYIYNIAQSQQKYSAVYINLSVPPPLPVAQNYTSNSFYILVDHKGSAESAADIPQNYTFIAQNRKHHVRWQITIWSIF